MPLATPFHTHPDREGGSQDVIGVDGEPHQAILISGSIRVIVSFICLDEDHFRSERGAFPIYQEHLQIQSKCLFLCVACTQSQDCGYHQGVTRW